MIREKAIIEECNTDEAVVVGKVPYCSIVGGHPAKPFKYRNINHYEELTEKQND